MAERDRGRSGVLDFNSSARMALTDLRDRVGLDSWLVARRDGDDCVVLVAVDDVFGAEEGRSWADSSLARMAEGSEPIVAPDVDRVPAQVVARTRTGVPAKSFLAVPMHAPDGEVIATLCAVGRQVCSEDLVDLLPTVQVQAAMLGTLLSHELRVAQEQRQAGSSRGAGQIDMLTGIGDRHTWDTALTEEESRASRHASSAAVVVVHIEMLDIVNKTAGHGAGDAVLQRAAGLLKVELRGTDVVARIGGAHFGILLPLTDLAGARVLAAHLGTVLAAAGLEASVGAGVRRSGKGMAQAWRDADAAMQDDRMRRVALGSTSPPTGNASETPPPPSVPEEAPRHRGPARSAAAPTVPVETQAVDDLVEPRSGSVDALLRLAREQLGMEVAFLNTFEGDNRRIRNIQSTFDLPIRAGFTEPSDRSHCRLLADRRIEEVTPDAAAVPLMAALPVTAALGIRAFVGVPVYRRNGELYGTLCTFSQRPDDTLRARDAEVLRSLSEIVMDLVEVEDRHESGRHELMARLERLYAAGGPHTVYQPVVTLDHLRLVGVEALSRSPGSKANPAEWFATAAAAGLGTRLELRALANAMSALPDVTGFLAVNVSPATVRTPAFSRQLAGHPLDRLVLELTEHEPIHDYSAVMDTLRPLRARGLRIAVDDVGAGFASMAHILALVPELIKLDVSLVRGIDTDGPRQALAAALSTFAAKTGAAIIAEGIEDAAELDWLRRLGIEYGQGYHLGRPGLLRPSPLGMIPAAAD